MGSVAKSVSSAGLELNGNAGILNLLADSAISALPLGPTTVIPAGWTNGARLLIQIYNHTVAGTITVVGTAPGSGAAVTETSTSFAVPETPSDYALYCTTNIYGTITASTGISVTGLTNGRIAIYGMQKATRMLIGETKISDKQTNASPAIQHGLYTKDRYNLALAQDPEWDFTGPLFANNAMIWLQTAFSNGLTFTTVPASATSLLASTSITSVGNASLTTQPTTPAMILVLTIGGTAPATAASISVTGTNLYGETITETVVATTKTQGTYYSKNAFASVAVNGVSFGAFGAGATVTVGGVFCASVTTSSPATDNLATFVLENYNSTSSTASPLAMVDEWEISFGMNQEAKITAKGKCQLVVKVGDVTNSANQVTAPPQEPEEALTGWETVYYIDNASGTFGTTQNQDCISGKVAIKPNWKTLHTSAFVPPYKIISRAYRNYLEATAEFVFDMTQATYNTEWVAFTQKRKRLIQVWVRGTPGFGTVASTAYYPGFKLNLIAYWIDMPTVDWSNGKESVQMTLPAKLFYDPAYAYAYNFTWFTQLIAGWT